MFSLVRQGKVAPSAMQTSSSECCEILWTQVTQGRRQCSCERGNETSGSLTIQMYLKRTKYRVVVK